MGRNRSAMGGPNSRTGRSTSSPAASGPQCQHRRIQRELLRRTRHEVAIEAEDLARPGLRVQRHATEDLPKRMQAVLERGDDAEVAAAAAHAPEEVGVLLGADGP